MTSPHRRSGTRSGLVLDTHDLGRRAGAMRQVRATVEAPADLGIAVIGVPTGSPLALDVRLESVVEGVLVTGTVHAQLAGDCGRCLVAISGEVEIDIQELFAYPESEATEDEVSRLDGDLVDLEPVVRDQIVLDLPFQPLCSATCRGLCPTCGADLNADPSHAHDSDADPRWAKLAGFGTQRPTRTMSTS